MYLFTTDNMTNAVIAGGASIPTWFAVIQDAPGSGVIHGVIASLVLLLLGKLMDLVIKLVLDKVKERRGDGKTNSEIKSGKGGSDKN